MFLHLSTTLTVIVVPLQNKEMGVNCFSVVVSYYWHCHKSWHSYLIVLVVVNWTSLMEASLVIGSQVPNPLLEKAKASGSGNLAKWLVTYRKPQHRCHKQTHPTNLPFLLPRRNPQLQRTHYRQAQSMRSSYFVNIGSCRGKKPRSVFGPANPQAPVFPCTQDSFFKKKGSINKNKTKYSVRIQHLYFW